MKKLIIISTFIFTQLRIHAQATNAELQSAVTKLDQANTVKDYQQLAGDFSRIAAMQKTQWLPYYYAAFCNAKIGWLKQDVDPDNIEGFAGKAEVAITKAQSMIDTAKQKYELSEIYCVQMMLSQARVFINPRSFGPKYGPTAFAYVEKAKRLNSANPRVLYLLGWEKFAAPKLFGGDKALAKQLLTQAKEGLNAQSSRTTEPHWGKKEVDDLLKQLK